MNLFLKPKVLNFYKEGVQGAGEAPFPLLKPPPYPLALAGARPITTQKALRLKISNSLRSNSEIFLTSPNFLLTALLACGLLANFITLQHFNELGRNCQTYNKYEVIKR